MNTNKPISYLIELSKLERQSMCMQILLLLNLCESGKIPTEIKNTEHKGKVFFEAKAIKKQLDSPSLANFHKGLYALYEAGFIDRLVIDKDGHVVMSNNYQRNTAVIYWKLTDKSRILLGA